MFVLIDGDNSKSTCTNVDEKMKQPNAIDLRLGDVFEIVGDTDFVLTEDGKTMREVKQIFPDPNTELFKFEKDKYYQVEFDNMVEVAKDELGWVIPRSSLNRNGVFIKSGLYDSGFKNLIGAVLYNPCGNTFIKSSTRIAQFLLAKTETRHLYDGQYNSK